MIKKILRIVALLAIDLVSKYFFYDLQRGSDLLVFSPHFNTGIARSLPMNPRISSIISLLVVVLFRYSYKRGRTSGRICALLTAGALGNIVDRIVYGGVRDFISIGSFPVFNIADMCITLAVILYFIQELYPCKAKTKPYI